MFNRTSKNLLPFSSLTNHTKARPLSQDISLTSRLCKKECNGFRWCRFLRRFLGWRQIDISDRSRWRSASVCMALSNLGGTSATEQQGWQAAYVGTCIQAGLVALVANGTPHGKPQTFSTILNLTLCSVDPAACQVHECKVIPDARSTFQDKEWTVNE